MTQKRILQTTSRRTGLVLVLVVLLALPLSARAGGIPFQIRKIQSDSRLTPALAAKSGQDPVFRETIQIPGAVWIRVQFGQWNLGEKSRVVITSGEDLGDQHLDAVSMVNYGHRSAIFNGDEVTVELFAHPEEQDVFITMDAVYYGEPDGNLVPKEMCGTDDRVAATDPAVGRFVYFDFSSNMIAKCTAWIASSGACLSAGHCFSRADYGDPDLIEFNVPLSDADGSPNFADPDDQYPVDVASVLRHENGVGDDYSVFDCHANSDTGLLPVQGQNDFFRPAKVSDISTPTTIRITGYGVDDDGGVADDQANRTLQTHAGSYITENTWAADVVSVEYQVDTTDGNSGGPVIINGTETAIGVHAHGGCNLGTGEGNHGTSFGNDDLEAALGNFFGSNVRYVDAGHPIASALENGTVFRPYDTVAEAVSHASPGAVIRIVSGIYTKEDGNAFTLGADGKPLMLIAPVGSVQIGN